MTISGLWRHVKKLEDENDGADELSRAIAELIADWWEMRKPLELDAMKGSAYAEELLSRLKVKP